MHTLTDLSIAVSFRQILQDHMFRCRQPIRPVQLPPLLLQIRELSLRPDEQFYFQYPPERDSYAEKIRELTTNILRAGPSALIIHCAETAKALICELLRRGVRVPEDISVIAFGSYDFDSEFNIPISSVDTDVREVIINAVRLLRERMENKKILSPSIALQPHLTPRESAAKIWNPL